MEDGEGRTPEGGGCARLHFFAGMTHISPDEAQPVYGYRSSWKSHSGPLMHKHDEVHKQLRGKGLKLVCCFVQLDLNDSYWQLRACVRAHALMSSATLTIFTLTVCFYSILRSTFLLVLLPSFTPSLALSLSHPPPSSLPRLLSVSS